MEAMKGGDKIRAKADEEQLKFYKRHKKGENMNTYPHLFSPLKVGPLVLKNRIESAPMGASGTVPFYTREAIELYGTIAKGGAAIVTLGEAGVHSKTDACHPTMPRLDNTETVASLIQTVDAVQRYGAFASIELNHSGNRSKPECLSEGGYIIGPSEGTGLYGAPIIAMDEGMMDEIAKAHAEAAYMAKFAGVDLCMLHCGHGWLLGQFLSKLDNHRTDQYGGSLENRAKFPLMVIERIRQRCGANFPIEVRISADELSEGGITLEESVEFAKMLDGKADIIHVSMGTFHFTKTACRMFPSTFLKRGCNLEYVEKIKGAVKKSLVTTVGSYADPDMMDEIIASGKADIIAVGRQLLADPDFPVKAKEGRADEINRCIRCNECCSAGFIPHVPFASGVLRCTVNPRLGREYETTRFAEPVKSVKKVLVAGAGPGGMEAALAAAIRGHEVILCEKTREPAYNLRYARSIDFKKDIGTFVDSLMSRIEKEPGIEVRFNTEVTRELVESERPDVLIAAMGAVPVKPDIPGIDNLNVHHIMELYGGKIELGKEIVIIGGGLAGCEEGLYLAESGKEVTILEMQADLAKDAPYIHWLALKDELQGKVKSEVNMTCTRIADEGVYAVGGDGKERLFVADTVLYAVGMKAKAEEAEQLRELVPEFYRVGDCLKPKKIMEAVRTGFNAGDTI